MEYLGQEEIVEQHPVLGFLSNHPYLGVVAWFATILVDFFSKSIGVIQDIATIGAFIVIILTIIAKSQEIKINRKKLRGR